MDRITDRPGEAGSAPPRQQDSPLTTLEQRRRRFERRGWAYAFAVILIGWAGLGWNLHSSMVQREATLTTQAERLAKALQMQIAQTLDVVQMSMAALSGQLVEHAHEPAVIEEILLSVGTRLPEFFSLAYIDANGIGVAASLPGFQKGGSFADRDYFRIHTAAHTGEGYVSGPLVGRSFGKQFIAVSRAIEAPDGRFLGVLMGSIDARHIARMFDEFPQGPRGAIALVHIRTRQVVARSPDHAAHFARDVSASPLFSGLLDQKSGSYETRTATDGLVRRIAYHRVPGAPLVALVGYARDDLRAEYGGWIRAHVAAGALFALVIVALAGQIMRSQRRAMDSLLTEEQLDLARRVIEASSEAIVVTDADNRIVSVNPALERITGYRREELIGRNPSAMQSGRHDRTFYDAMWQAILAKGEWEGEVWDRRCNGELYPKWLRINVIRGEDGRIVNHIGMFADITERKASEEQVRHIAHHDALTGLPNRFSLHERLGQAIGQARRDGRYLALMLIDLDRFKAINDTLGHDVGDGLLLEVARRLSQAVRDSDIVSRLGGDEFVVVLTGIDGPAAAALVADKIVTGLSAPYTVKGYALRSSPSIGICLYPDDGKATGELLKNADVAMYQAKAQGRATYQFFTKEMQLATQRRVDLESDLNTAFAQGQFELHYQPQLDLRSGRISGVEALLRWRHPQRGMVSPGEFVPVAEETGLIVPLGDWVLRAACRQLAAWRLAGLDGIRMAVNLSARQFADPALPERIREILAEQGLPGDCLDLEVTESMAMHSPAETIEHMRQLSGQGMTLSIDDFGTGYSSLAYLKLFPIHTLKIDRSFVKDIESDPNDADICDVTVLLAHKLGLEVVAEGVETDAQLKYLLSIGCEKVQGYRIGRPMPAAELETFIRSTPPLTGLGTTELWSAG